MIVVIPENVKLFRDFVKKTMNPFGLSLSSCGDWCSNSGVVNGTILYSGCLYLAMDIVLQKGILKIMTSNPKEKLVKLSKIALKFGPIYRAFLRTKPVVRSTPRKALWILNKLGFSVGCLREEPYSGALLYDYGLEEDFAEYAQKVYQYLREKNVKRLIVLDPHTYEIMKFIYPKFVDNYDLEVLNILDILRDNLDESKIKHKVGKVTIHDPCHYARSQYRRIIEEPREILRVLGATIVEPLQTREMTWCCGGPIESLYGIVSEKIAEKRAKQLLSTNAKNIVVMCPVCLANLTKAVKHIDSQATVTDLLDLVYEAMGGGD